MRFKPRFSAVAELQRTDGDGVDLAEAKKPKKW